MYLIDLIKDHHKIISVIGMAKNAGKTVALNEIIYQALENGLKIGLTSIGRDGERQDVVTYTEKPTIYADEGMLIATAEGVFNNADARLEILDMTDYPTSMGRILIAKVIHPGHVQIAGPCSNQAIRDVSERMLAFGADRIIVDGALDRVSSASPSITDAAILSTGAVLSRDMDKVVEQTSHRVHLFQLPAVQDADVHKIAKEVVEAKKNVVIDVDEEGQKNVQEMAIRTALNAGKIIADHLHSESRYVVIQGSLVTKTLMDIIKQTRQYKQITFIVRDATRIFIEHRDWLYFKKAGIQIQVLDPIEIVAVTVNPYSPMGYYFDPQKFKNRLTEQLNPIPVFDVVHGGEA